VGNGLSCPGARVAEGARVGNLLPPTVAIGVIDGVGVLVRVAVGVGHWVLVGAAVAVRVAVGVGSSSAPLARIVPHTHEKAASSRIKGKNQPRPRLYGVFSGFSRGLTPGATSSHLLYSRLNRYRKDILTY